MDARIGLGKVASRLDPVPEWEKRFWSKCETNGGAVACWIWSGRRNAWGAGEFRGGQNKILAHRLAWSLMHGSVPRGFQVVHRCEGGPACVNPRHLELQRQPRRAVNQPKRPPSRPRRFTPEVIREIRAQAANGTSQAELGERHGVTAWMIGHIVRRRAYADVE